MNILELALVVTIIPAGMGVAIAASAVLDNSDEKTVAFYDMQADLSVVVLTEGRPDQSKALERFQDLDARSVSLAAPDVVISDGVVHGRMVFGLDVYDTGADPKNKARINGDVVSKVEGIGREMGYQTVLVQAADAPIPNEFQVKGRSEASTTTVRFAQN